jgi:hypothetical protein
MQKVGTEKVTPGIYSLPAEKYFAAEGVSASMLDILARKTPAHLKAAMDGEAELVATPAMEFGVILHRALLEPDSYRGAFHVRPDEMKFTTKAGKEWQAAHSDKPILDAQDAARVSKMVDAVHTHPFAKRLLHGAQTERSIFVEDSHGTLRKARIDALTAGNILPDIKTCESASDEAFERTISRLRYHARAAFYLDQCNLAGIEKDIFFFIAVEKTPPYCVRCLQLNGEVAMVGRTLYQRDLQIYRTCLETGNWPAWSDDFDEVGLPQWEMRAIEQLGV